jgi:hypothetical protein
MSDMQTKSTDESEKYYWYLKTIEEQEQKRRLVEQPDTEHEINILRFIKQLEPTGERLMEICQRELGIPFLTASSILETLEKAKEIQYVVGESGKKIEITKKGMQRLDNGG